jgi:hypothetical protein
MALYAWCTALVFAIAAPALFESSVKNLPRRGSHGKSVRFFGPSLPPHLFRESLLLPPLKLPRRCLSLLHLNFLPNTLLSQSFGVIGNAVTSGVGGSSCFVHKRFFSLLICFNGRRKKTANRQIDRPEPNVPIGVSHGMSVSLVTLVHPVSHLLPSLFMAFLPPLPSSLAWLSWLLRNRLPVCSFWSVPAHLPSKVRWRAICSFASRIVDRQAMWHARMPFCI